MTEPLGLHRERTALAWMRTALALAGATAILARLAYPGHPWAAVALAAAAVILLGILAPRLVSGATGTGDRDGRLPAATAGLAVVVAGLAALVVFGR
ncbi:DUF202 domain-containing protein [Pseudonocardiaceae bacterium YIM PH 21723]|nr:DUF202 domain-containing protein [Pseudonocardiaceae bacterium YIM PH 21723]